MTKKNNGRDFEDMVHRIYSTLLRANPSARISRNTRVDGPVGKREIDILIDDQIAGHNIRTVIECKDHKRPVDVGEVDLFSNKVRTLHASKGIMVSRSGFTDQARSQARHDGIELRTASKVNEATISKFQKIPIHLSILRIDLYGPLFRVGKYVPENIDLDRPFNGLYARDIIAGAVKGGIIKNQIRTNLLAKQVPSISRFNSFIDMEELFGHDAIWISNGQDRVFVTEATLALNISYINYFGYMDALETALQLTDESKGEATVAFDTRELAYIRDKLTPVSRLEDIPEPARNYGLSLFEVDFGTIEHARAEVWRDMPD